jgi:hypothetical protein
MKSFTKIVVGAFVVDDKSIIIKKNYLYFGMNYQNFIREESRIGHVETVFKNSI